MVNPRVRLLGLLLPVLVTPLGLPALLALGFVAIFMAHELTLASVPYSPLVPAISPSALCRVVNVFLSWWVVDVAVRFFWVRVLVVVAPVALWCSGGLSLATRWMVVASTPALVLWANLVRSSRSAADYGSGRLFAQTWLDSEWLLRVVGVACDVFFGWRARWLLFPAGGALWLFLSGLARVPLSRLRLRAYIRWHISAAAVSFITLCSLPASEAMGDGRKLLSDLIKVTPGCWFVWLLVPEGLDSWILYGIGSLCLAVRMWQ